MLSKKIAVIGAGKMGGALINGLLSAKLVASKNIIVCDKDKNKLKSFARKKIKTTASNIKAVERSDVIILSVKPKDMKCVLDEIALARNARCAAGLKRKLFISIAAGIKTAFIENRLGKVPVIRVMPNIPALIGEGISAFSLGRFTASSDERIAGVIFRSVGVVMKLPEKNMDAVTALSGSGPAYFFFLMEALTLAGKKMGISAKDSLFLTLQTALGAGLLAKKSGIPPAKLREMVTSKGGTTEAAFKVFNNRKVKDAVIKAVIQAQKRSEALSCK